MAQYLICTTLIVFLFLLVIHETIQDLKILRNPFKRVALCLFLTLLFKYNYGIHFYGLEYEDAFVFSFCARQFLYNIFPTSFLIDGVSVGSLTEPTMTSTYGGHFIMYPAYLSLFTSIFGWSPVILSIANTVLAFFILLVLSILPRNRKSWFIPPVIYCCAPIVNVFTTCFLSEIFSSFICLTFIYAFIRKRSTLNNALCIISFVVAIMCKRENLALLIVPTLELMFLCKYKSFSNKKNVKDLLLRYAPYYIILILYFLFIQDVFEIERVESKDIESSTFSMGYLKILLPAFVKSLLSLETFSVAFILLIIRIAYLFFYKKSVGRNEAIMLILFGVYLMLYSSHYRGYFFVKEESVSSFETYRYINNFFYLIPVVFVGFCNTNLNRFKLIACSILILTFSIYHTYSFRLGLSEIEHEERFKEAELVSKYIRDNSKNSLLICENILVYQNLCDDKFNVCDIRLKNALEKNKIHDCYLLLSDIGYLNERYSLTITLQDIRPVMHLGNGRYLYKYTTDNGVPIR